MFKLYLTSILVAEVVAVAAALAFRTPGVRLWHLVPIISLTLVVANLYARHPKAAFGVAMRRGLTPITIGLIFASAWILLPAINADWRGYALTGLTVFLVLRTKLNPIWVLVGGAAAGMAGIV